MDWRKALKKALQSVSDPVEGAREAGNDVRIGVHDLVFVRDNECVYAVFATQGCHHPDKREGPGELACQKNESDGHLWVRPDDHVEIANVVNESVRRGSFVIVVEEQFLQLVLVRNRLFKGRIEKKSSSYSHWQKKKIT